MCAHAPAASPAAGPGLVVLRPRASAVPAPSRRYKLASPSGAPAMHRFALACSFALSVTACVDADEGPTSAAVETTVSPLSGPPDPTTDAAETSSTATTTTGDVDEPDTTGEPEPPATSAATGEPATTGTYGPCGDGRLDEYESCDDGMYNADDGPCTTACRFAVCGDGLVHKGVELCDDGNQSNTDLCRTDCEPASCGDGYVQVGEVCDDGDDDDTDECPNSCSAGGCGDGFVQVGEACDDGNASTSDACLNSCQAATCGDGAVQVGVEACDDGNGHDTDACSNSCKPPTCDDGVRNGFESDVDCGGNSCPECGPGDKCATNLDCSDSICKQGLCSPPQALMPPGCAPAQVSASQAYAAVKPSCGCHGNGAGGLPFTDSNSFRNNMVAVDSATAQMQLVAPGQIDQSYLIYKILNQQSSVPGGYGSPMPVGKPLSDANKCLLINWVKSGAN